MQRLRQPKRAHATQIPALSAAQPLPSKRRPKYSARYRGYVNKPDVMMDDDPSSDDAARPANLRRSSRHLNNNQEEALNQPSDVQTTAPSSPYDADEEDEGRRDAPTAESLRKRRKRSLPRPPAKHSRRVSSRRTSRASWSNSVGELASPRSVEDGAANQSDAAVPNARKRSQSGLDTDCGEPAPVSHAEPDGPGITLWDHDRKVLVLGRVLPSHLAQVLRNNKSFAIYVGQDEKYLKCPGDVLSLSKPVHQEPWMNELRKPPAERRVMIIDPKSAKLLGPRKCPTPGELASFLEDLAKERAREVRRRVFNAHYTDSHGFTRANWDSMFSVPPPLSNKIAKCTARDSDETLGRLQLAPQVPSAPPSSTPLPSLPPRGMRRLKSVRYTEVSSDPAEFQSSESDRSDDALRKSKVTLPPQAARSLSRPFVPSSPGSEGLDSQNDDDDGGRKERRKIYQDIFPVSSSEHERADIPELSSPNPSSDESEEAKNVHAPVSSVDRDNGDTKTVSPSSILVLNRTPSFSLQKLYSFQESSASEDSLSEALDGKRFNEAQHLDGAYCNEAIPPSQEKLRLQLQNRSKRDAQIVESMHQSEQRKGIDSLSLRLDVGKSSINSNSQHKSEAPIEQEEPNVKNEHKPEDEAKCDRSIVLSVLAKPRRQVREKSCSALERNMGQPEYDVTECEGSLAERPKEGSNDASSGKSRRNSIRNKRIGTNEKVGIKRAAKNGESAEDGVTAPTHVATTRSREATRSRRSQPKESASSSVIERRRSANAKYLHSDDDHVIEDLKTSYAEEEPVPPIHAEGSEAVSSVTVAQQSEEVYLWDYSSKTKSDTPIPLATALELCKANDLTMIYDGQDIKNGDQRYGEIWSDTKAWISRQGTRPAFRRKVRVWDHCTGRTEKFCFSPPICEVEQWLKDNPDNSLYRPSLYVQYEHHPPIEEAKNTGFSVQSRVKRAIRIQVLNRIEHLGVTDLCEGPQQRVVLWNILKRKCEAPRDFASRSHLTRFLFSNPALELFRGQDEVLRLERCTELKLLSITRDCPAGAITFWDTKLRRTCVRPKEREKSRRKTVQECIDAEPELELYAGQDRPDMERIRQMVRMSKRSLSHSSFTLAKCSELLQTHVYSKGWVPKYIDTQKESALNATFWSKSQKALRMESLEDPRLSIEQYLTAAPDLEVYVGQDMSAQVQKQLHWWFQLLKYETGTDASKAAPTLLRHSLVPLKYRAIRFTSGIEFRTPKKPFKRQRRRRQEASKAEPEDEVSKREKRTSVKRQRLSLRVNKRSEYEGNHHTSDRSFSDEEEFLLDDGRDPETEITRPHSQDTTNYEEENLDGSSGPGCAPTLSSSTLEDRYSESHSEDDDEIGAEGDASGSFPDHPQNIEDLFRSATKSVKKMVCVIREAGPKVLKRELRHDVRQHLREQLILEVESVPHLVALVKEFSSYDFAAVANQLCEELQLLDVHGCFSCSADLGYTPNDLSSIREDLAGGRICTSHAVITKFREVCAGLIQFHEGSLLHGQASLLRLHGEELIARFQKSHALHLEKEQRMLDVFRICERAKQIGFRTGPRNRNSKHVSNLLSLGSSEPSLRVSGSQPEVTFLNYRDEKGNSVMGKRPSVRVFGFTIDTNALEHKIGNIKPCHICRTDVVVSRADSMQCSNRIFGICEEVVCKECVETIFSLEQDEFKILRDNENWFCVHCRGLCPSGSECTTGVISTTMSSPAARYHLKFVWPYAPSGAKSIYAVISKRHRNGEYDLFPENLPEDKLDLSRDMSGKNWFTYVDLAIGAYRCQVMVDNAWVASSTFQVLPSPADPISAYKPKKPCMISQASVSYVRGPHAFVSNPSEKLAARSRPRGPRIRWHPIPKGPAHAVHAIRDSSVQDGGTLVKTCSRTEGYDWRRAKRHATLQWLPELRSADECQGTQLGDSKSVVLCAIDSERAHLAAFDNPPTPCTGISHQDFLVTLNTYRYNEMLKSLWSIVTGRSHIHGIGLFTLSGYKKGDFVIEYAGDLIRTPLADIREARYDAAGLGTYLFKINEDQIVDATVQSNRARFTNHSCDPNMVADIVHVQGRDLIVLRATREIPRFAELTFDYKFPYEEAKVQCLCNSWNCVGVMN